MRVRASRGLRIAAFYGHFFIRGVDLLALPNVARGRGLSRVRGGPRIPTGGSE